MVTRFLGQTGESFGDEWVRYVLTRFLEEAEGESFNDKVGFVYADAFSGGDGRTNRLVTG